MYPSYSLLILPTLGSRTTILLTRWGAGAPMNIVKKRNMIAA
jgi:hypothetical protein